MPESVTSLYINISALPFHYPGCGHCWRKKMQLMSSTGNGDFGGNFSSFQEGWSGPPKYPGSLEGTFLVVVF